MAKRPLRRQERRTYQETHPWIQFGHDLRGAPASLWMMFGEARSKCDHIAGVPLPPNEAAKLYTIYLSKGVHATTSIEGNTLSEQQVRQQVEGRLILPRSQEYLAVEVQNVIDACDQIRASLKAEPKLKLTPELICRFNALVLRGLEVDDHVRPGEYRTQSVGVANYRGAPWEDCPYLVERMCDWLNTEFEPKDDEWKFSFTLLKPIFAHLYIAWIHPFGDGNGRTARLLEFLLLAQSGVPLPAAHLLSNHYNKTRDRYYAGLDRSSKAADGVVRFVAYALEGFVDGLNEQLDYIRNQQLQVTWVNYVHTVFREKTASAFQRQKHLVLDMPDEPVHRKNLVHVSPRVAEAYAGTGEKTLGRDIKALLELQLLARIGDGYIANKALILAFLPPRYEA
jgi:Fic family protein